MFFTNTHKIGYPSLLLFLYYKSRFGQRKKWNGFSYIFIVIVIIIIIIIIIIIVVVVVVVVVIIIIIIIITTLESDRNMDIHIEIFVDNKV